MALDQQLLEILRCPKCKGTLDVQRKDEEETAFICPTCRLSYPVIDGIPNFLISEADSLDSR